MIERLVIVTVSMVISLYGVWLIRRVVPHERLRDNNEFAGLAFALIGAVYGVYLAFTVVVVWEQFGEAERNATSEAVYLSQVWRDVEVLPVDTRIGMQDLLTNYAASVIGKEWSAMEVTRAADPETARIYDDIWRHLYASRGAITAPGDVAFFNEAVVQMNQLGMSRRLRLLSASAELPPVMWTLLLGGAVVTILLTYTIGTRHAWIHGAFTAVVTGLIVFSLLIVAALQHPFAGDVSVRPDGMKGVHASFLERIAQR